MTGKFVQVLVNSGTRMTDKPFTYALPSSLDKSVQRGSAVYVPFGRGNRKTPAMVLDVEERIPDFPTKEVISKIDELPDLSEESLAIAEFLVETTLSDWASAIQSVLPPGTIGEFVPKIRTFYRLTDKGKTCLIPDRAYRQAALVEYLKKEGEEEQVQLLKVTGASSSTLKALLGKGWIEKSDRRVARRQVEVEGRDSMLPLTGDQKKVFDRISRARGTYLVCGVTGSGKTEIYLQLVDKTLREGKQAIVLVPEISLTPQTIARFEGRFGRQVAILHSRLSTSERYEEWEKIREGEVSIAIGARSAIFAPFDQLGLIVIDEEHEGSYISEKNPKYHTYDLARFRAKYNGASLVLGTATPSVTTLYRVDQGEIIRLNLPKRVGSRPMPRVDIVDMREELKANNRTMFSRSLHRAIDRTLKEGNQVILFLNKRGHTSFVFCRSCGYVYRCDACDVAMTYHKGQNRLICHYCGREKTLNKKCPNCGSTAIRDFGAGTEQLEEEVRRLFPRARVVRADADTMTRKGAYDRVYRDMLAGRIDILLGTQMIAKGFDFPRVTLVGVMAADISLNLPDIRANERTFQLITQVAGRAGRGDHPGQVIIQTYKSDHPAIVTASQYDVDAFYSWEKKIRAMNHYPPYREELHIRLTSPDRASLLEKAYDLRAFIEGRIKQVEDGQVEGPTPSVIERVNRRYRFGIMVRSIKQDDLRILGREILDRFPSTPKINIVLTMDPVSIF
ncbi:replication restart helicase PriA [Kallipyga gabonensis]|uniref:replication restart helicase PriA n=1 Tax=Kallipyga gabonensis TaxID=1686287 RepID=UPI0006B41BC2|nr:primosomal protein N' [Kallipyga gabonensis]